MSSRRLIELLTGDGWYEIRGGGGTSHRQFKHPAKPGRVTVPHPKKDLPIGTTRSALRQAGLPLNAR